MCTYLKYVIACSVRRLSLNRQMRLKQWLPLESELNDLWTRVGGRSINSFYFWVLEFYANYSYYIPYSSV